MGRGESHLTVYTLASHQNPQSLLSRGQSHLRATQVHTRQCQRLPPGFGVPALDLSECLTETNGGVAGFRQGELLTEADTRAACEITSV